MSKINWERSQPTNRDLGWRSKDGHFYEMMRLKSTPTAKQKKYFKYLAIRCKEEGINPKILSHNATRDEYSRAIDGMVKALGIEHNAPKKPD